MARHSTTAGVNFNNFPQRDSTPTEDDVAMGKIIQSPGCLPIGAMSEPPESSGGGYQP